MTKGFVKRELVGGPKDGHRVLVGANLRELVCLGLGPATRLITRPDDGLGAMAPMTRGRYVLAENGDLTWEGYS